jgi:murein DD-endopeptidase MepM/ murein hydrolase activator NlpD
LRARLILIPIVTTVMFLAFPASPAGAAKTTTERKEPAAGWLVRSTVGLRQPVELVTRMREAERQRLLAIVKVLTSPPPPVTDPNSFIWPANAKITSAFGRRGGRAHTGVDIDAPYGAPIVAAQAGTVTLAGWKNGYGQTVIIDHGHGIRTLYAHESRLLVRVGQRVNQGDLIGKVGATGHVTAPHLHYEVHVNGVPRNPTPWL